VTELYAATFESYEESSYLSFVTSDDYPHTSNYENDGTPFHLLRSGKKTHDTFEMLMVVLGCALDGLEFPFHTECPQVTSMECEEITYKGIKAALLDFGKGIIVSTIVVPEGAKVDTP
jgi:hypothetical protein